MADEEDVVDAFDDAVEKARGRGLLPRGAGKKRAVLNRALTSAKESRAAAASASFYRDRVDMGRKRVGGSIWRSGPEQHAELTSRMGRTIRRGNRNAKLAGYLMSRGVRKALDEAIEKAGLRLSGVRVSPAQRRKLAMQSGGKRKPRTFNVERTKRIGYAQYRGSKAPPSKNVGARPPGLAGSDYVLGGRSQSYRRAMASSNKGWKRDALSNAREAVHHDRQRRGVLSPYKRTLFGGLKRVRKADDIHKAKPKTFYVYRPVENAEDIIAWAKAQGFGSTLEASDLHVTIAFSKTALNWTKIGDDYCAEDPRPGDNADGPRYAEPCVTWSDGGRKQRKIEGGAREVKSLGDKGAVVLAFQSPSLTERWAQFVRIGASWDYAGFTPHITITYKGKGVDLEKVEPYTGPIILGEEDWNEIEEGAGEDVPEVVTKADLDAVNARLAAVEKAQSEPAKEAA